MIRCSSCNKDLGVYDSRSSWLKLMHYFEIELTQGDITEATYETLMDALIAIEPEGDRDATDL